MVLNDLISPKKKKSTRAIKLYYIYIHTHHTLHIYEYMTVILYSMIFRLHIDTLMKTFAIGLSCHYIRLCVFLSLHLHCFEQQVS